MNDIIKKIRSIAFHQLGVSEQHVTEHDLAINKNGVAIQCNVQIIELKVSILSEFSCKIDEFVKDIL